MSDDEHKVSLRDHFEKQIEWVDRYFERRVEDAQERVDKAEQQLNKRLEGMNEFRDTLKDQASQFITKREHEAVESRISAIERALSSAQGRGAIVTVLWAMGASILTAVMVIVISKLLVK